MTSSPLGVSEAFADARIEEKIASAAPKPREGLARVAHDMKQAGVAPGYRLHLLSGVVDLGRVAEATLPARMARHAVQTPRREEDFWGDNVFID